MKRKPSEKQTLAVNNILSGKFKSKAEAMRYAGYAKTTSLRAGEKLFNSKGVQAYLATIDDKARKRWGTSIEGKVLEVYMDGLEATKLVGRDSAEHPDWMARKAFADSFASFFGWKQPEALPISGNKIQNFNFFSLPEAKRESFNHNFDQFLKKFYGV